MRFNVFLLNAGRLAKQPDLPPVPPAPSTNQQVQPESNPPG
jgi:hypothetical protein